MNFKKKSGKYIEVIKKITKFYKKSDLIFENEVKKFLEYIYEYLLGRKPDKKGFDSYRNYLQNTGISGFSNVLKKVAESEEYIGNRKIINFEEAKEFNFKSLRNLELSKLFEKTSFYWRNSGSEPKNIYWSVLSSDNYQDKKPEPSEIKKFLSTGVYDVDRIKRICKIVDFNFDSCKEFLDYGCGVGRVVVNLPENIKKVNCVDFSTAHLEETFKNLKYKSNFNNIYSKFLINSYSDLVKLPNNQDIIHSFIVLQHNTPPIIERIIGTLLRRLSFNGLAILHVPIAKNNYSFNTNEYLSDESSGKNMEMHILPKSNLHILAKENASKIVFSFCDGGCAGDIYSEIVVFQKQFKK